MVIKGYLTTGISGRLLRSSETIRPCRCVGLRRGNHGENFLARATQEVGREGSKNLELLESALSAAVSASRLKSAFSHAAAPVQRCRAEAARYCDSLL